MVPEAGRVEDVSHGERHFVRQVGRRDRVHSVIERVRHLRFGSGGAIASGGTLGDHVAGRRPYRDPVVALFTFDLLGRCHGDDLQIGAFLDALEIDLQPACGWHNLGK